MRSGLYTDIDWPVGLHILIINWSKVNINFSKFKYIFLKCHLLEHWKHKFGSLSSNPYSLAPGPATQPKSPSKVFQNNFSAKTNSILLDLSALFKTIFFSLLIPILVSNYEALSLPGFLVSVSPEVYLLQFFFQDHFNLPSFQAQYLCLNYFPSPIPKLSLLVKVLHLCCQVFSSG